LKLRERNNKLYNGNIYRADNESALKAENKIENILKKLYEVYLEARR
jgi:hypothetical protein